ncbi:MAG: topoisomerase C-terminal repeat-containing protein, partial [Burkholderiaceae bacterium]
MNYLCERSVGPTRSCDFRSGKVILQQSIERAQMEKLLTTGRTDLLRGFVSNRTRRKFAAYLMRKPDGTTGFEFEPRAAKAPGGTTGRAAKGRAKATTEDVVAPVVDARPTVKRATKVAKTVKSPAKKSAATKAAVGVTTTAVKTSTSAIKKAVKKSAKSAAKTAAKTPARTAGARRGR